MTARYADLLAVIKSRTTIDGDCWLFAGPDNGRGYKTVGSDYAHRQMHRLCIGPIPEGFEVDHLCRRRACVNPAHLEAVTPAENKRRATVAKTQCKNGHALPPFTGVQRDCRTCQRIRAVAREQRMRDGVTPRPPVKPHQHGTPTGYKYGCRCDACRAANAVQSFRFRAMANALNVPVSMLEARREAA